MLCARSRPPLSFAGYFEFGDANSDEMTHRFFAVMVSTRGSRMHRRADWLIGRLPPLRAKPCGTRVCAVADVASHAAAASHARSADVEAL